MHERKNKSLELGVRMATAIALGLLGQACSGVSQASISPLDCGTRATNTFSVSSEIGPNQKVVLTDVATFGVTDDNNLTIMDPAPSVDEIVILDENSITFENTAIFANNQIYTATLTSDGQSLKLQASCAAH